MIKNILSLVLLIASATLNFKHGWDAFNYKSNPESFKMMNMLAIGEPVVVGLGILAIASGLLMLVPQTFFFANTVNAIAIVVIMAFALRAGNIKMALVEIPFLAIPLVMIWLKYPFKN